jgi:hypothetical protein
VSGYVRDVVIKRTFQDDQVTIVMRPAKFSDLMKVADLRLDKKELSPKEVYPVIEVARPYLKTLSGLKANDASEVTADEFFENAYFMELLTEVLIEWIDKALPSNPPSPGASPAA